MGFLNKVGVETEVCYVDSTGCKTLGKSSPKKSLEKKDEETGKVGKSSTKKSLEKKVGEMRDFVGENSGGAGRKSRKREPKVRENEESETKQKRVKGSSRNAKRNL